MTSAFSPASSRLLLERGWEMCWTAPDAAADPDALLASAPQWLSCPQIGTAARQLESLGLWSLDGAPRDFDADDWWFRCSFARPDASRHWTLGFDGIATVATVWLNGHPVLKSENMFLRHELDVASTIDDSNQLYICCRSLRKWLEAKRPRPRWKAPMVSHQQLRWARTTLLGRTPGWSPSVAPVGPWRLAWLEGRSTSADPRLQLLARVESGAGVIVLAPNPATEQSDFSTLELRVESPDGAIERRKLERNTATGEWGISIQNPRLWWPHTHGEPNLYRVELMSGDDRLAHADLGFRTIEIRQPESDFALHINGQRVFCRGACWTPLDIVSLNASDDRTVSALRDVAADGMNMVRVVGAMTYENEAFHSACDRLGIFVWHDFMFANMDYPVSDPAFTASVETEVRQQVERLRAHPSLAVLCGNSEVEQQSAMFGAPRALWAHPLFHEFIPRIVQGSAAGVPYWPSSTHGRDPIAPSSGTASYYGVGAYLLALEDARRSEVHFATECLALANVPDAEALRGIPVTGSLRVHSPAWKARVPRDLTAGWDFDDVRDAYLKRLFGVDPLGVRYEDHEHYLHLSRVVSGEVMADAFSQWRAGTTCHGALVLFLRDFVAGAGWGLRSSDGRRKPALEMLRRVLQPQAILLTDEGCNGVTVHVVNDRPVPLVGKVVIEFGRTTGRQSEVSKELSVAAGTTLSLRLSDLCEHFVDTTHVYRFGPPSSDYVAARFEGDASIAPAFHFPVGRQFNRVESIGLEAKIEGAATGAPTLSVSTRELARYVWVEVDGFTPESHYIHLAPGETRLMTLHPSGRVQAASGHVFSLNSQRAARIKASA